jgi:hypothetical protein
MPVLVLVLMLEPHPDLAKAQDAEQAGVGPMRSWAIHACARVHVDHHAAYRSHGSMAACLETPKLRVSRRNENPIDSG